MNNIVLILCLLTMSATGQEQECKEEQFSQTRVNYESCASKKIHEITSWLQREEGGGELKEEGVTAVCSAVRELIHECGNALAFCFSDAQVEETKQKQRAGLKTILAKHYSQEKMEKCFLRKPEGENTESATPDSPQEEKILRNIEALLEFTTPTPTAAVSKSAFTTPVITTTETTTILTTTVSTTVAATTAPVTTTSSSTTTTKPVTTKTTTTVTPSNKQTTIKPASEANPSRATKQSTTITITETPTPSVIQPSDTSARSKNIVSSTTIISTTALTSTSTRTSTLTSMSTISSTSTTLSPTTTTTETRKVFPDFDRGTTQSPVEPFKCEESEFTETRDNYERCASNKIREITAWLERKERRRRRRKRAAEEEKEDSILTVCNAVRQLLYDCGNELGWCFTENQVSETRYKQREGLETILSKHYTPEKLEMCFVQENTPELVNISQVVENQTEKSRDRNSTVNTNTVKAAEKDTEDISENIVSDTGDRSPRVFPSTKTSSSLPVKSLSFLHILNILILLVAFT